MYAEFGVGPLHKDGCARRVEVLLADVAQAHARRCGGVHAELEVVADGEPVACGRDADVQGLFGAHDVVFDSVFDEQLQAAGYDIAPKQGPGNVDLDLESLGEPFLQEVDILAGEFEFLLQGYQLFVGFF